MVNEQSKKLSKCVLCGAPIMLMSDGFTRNPDLWANNAWPVAEGYCCPKCNREKVIPARIAAMRMSK